MCPLSQKRKTPRMTRVGNNQNPLSVVMSRKFQPAHFDRRCPQIFRVCVVRDEVEITSDSMGQERRVR